MWPTKPKYSPFVPLMFTTWPMPDRVCWMEVGLTRGCRMSEHLFWIPGRHLQKKRHQHQQRIDFYFSSPKALETWQTNPILGIAGLQRVRAFVGFRIQCCLCSNWPVECILSLTFLSRAFRLSPVCKYCCWKPYQWNTSLRSVSWAEA